MKTLLKTLVLFAAITVAQIGMAQNGWTQKADFGGGARYAAVGFSIGSKGYVGTGDSVGGGLTSGFWEYDPATNAWAQKANVGGPGRYFAVGFSIGSKGYIGTGWVSSALTNTNDFWEYDPATNTWTQRANFGGGARHGAVGFSIGTKGYVGTGTHSTNDYTDFYEYDPTTDTWTQKADVGGLGRYGAVGFSIGNKGYIGTGDHLGGAHPNDFWEYDPLTNVWIQKASCGGGIRSHAVGFSVGTKGFLGTGTNTVVPGNHNDFWEYDPTTNTWTRNADFGGGIREAAFGFAIGSLGYVGTGQPFYPDLWEFDPAQGCVVGSPCDDGNPNTTGDVYSSTCVCAGTCPDTDGDGICDVVDNCPSLAGQQGDACNDNNACTIDDVITAACTCAGTILDSDNDGIADCSDNCPNTPGQMGDPCDDGDPCTVNDNVDGTCTCAGSFQDSDSDGICNALDNCVLVPGVIGSTCDDGDPCTINDELNSICLCTGTSLPDADGDGICDVQDDCPTTPGVENGPCDDGDPCTLGEFLTSCVCGGGTISPDSDGDGTCDALEADWTQVASASMGRQAAVGFAIDGKGYFATGNNGAGVLMNDTWQYDPLLDAWTQMADLTGPARAFAAGFAIDDKGYLGTGTGGGFHEDFYEFDPALNSWSQKADFGNAQPGIARGGAVGFAVNDMGYMGTGYGEFVTSPGDSTEYKKDLWAYDPTADTWTQVADFPTDRRVNAVAFTIGTKAYVATGLGYATGSTIEEPLKDFFEYDPSTDIWTPLADVPGDGRQFAIGLAMGGHGYVGTGFSYGGLLKDFYKYDPVADTWTPRTDFPGSARSMAACFAINDTGYVGTGWDGTIANNDLWRYAPESCTTGSPCSGPDPCMTYVFNANCACVGTPVNDADNDGVCDENDLCTGTPTGEGVNTDGCSCSQLTVDDGIPCTVDACTDGIVTHTLLDGDVDLDGVCDGADACANTPTGEAVNASGCACSEQTMDDGNACTVDDCLNGVVTHTLMDADADGICDTDDACPGTVSGAVVSTTGCACAQLPTVCFDGACAAGQLVVGVNGPYSNAGASVQAGEPQPPTGACNNQLGWCIGQAPSHSVWFSFVAPPSGKVSLNFGSTTNWDSQIALWSAADCDALLTGGAVLVAANDDITGGYPYHAAIAPMCVTAGATYFVQVDGFNTTTFENFQLVLVEEATLNCDDGLACTVDSYNCSTGQCLNTFQDADGDGVCDANDNCPSVLGQIGSSCDDNNANTTNDVLNASCVCVGTTACSANPVVLTLNTDANGAQTSWSIDPLTLDPSLCSGSGYPDLNSIAVDCCLPNGCYVLSVYDSFGDGMSGGGYTLRDANDQRIVDNDGSFGSVSQPPLGFCVPIGTDALDPVSCDQQALLSTDVLRSMINPTVSAEYGIGDQTDDGYQLWVFNPDGGYSRRIFQSHASPGTAWPPGTLAAERPAHQRLNWTAQPIPQYTLLNVRVRSRVNGVNAEFGPACRLKVDPTANCQTTQLTTQNPGASCGAVNIALPGGLISANVVTGAVKYQFQFTRPGYVRKIASATRTLTLTNWATSPLQCGLSYDVKVRASMDGIAYCPFGASCSIAVAACAPFGGSSNHQPAAPMPSGLTLWPNPDHGEALLVSVDGLDPDATTAAITITDVAGRVVLEKHVVAADGSMKTSLTEVGALPPGVFVVQVTAGTSSRIERLVIE